MQVASGVFLAPDGMVAPVDGALDIAQNGVDRLHSRLLGGLSAWPRRHSLRRKPKIIE